jgi:DNA polymerase-3 subunit gamma/tau
MDNFIVSARKYRPDNFESVVGQDAITQTLKNSIKINQLAQAYLFCGPRGIGKTTCARIFAKTINCTNLTDEHEACNKCESCVAFNQLRSLNIHELDAASNNSVDDIRNLIDQVRIPPQIGSYNVYIIDEVHMLSSSAFNAFLKTLEEPPKHVIFILATTEKHKILPTILSRCQVFDFNRIGVEDICKRLEYVAQREGIDAEHDALHVIAQKADGAMRDALSIFDQIVSFSGKHVTYESTINNLNVLDYEEYFKITDAFLAGNYVESLSIFDRILKRGFEGNYFITGLASHFRDLLVCKDPGTVELLEVGKKTKTRYMEHSTKCSISFLFKAIEIANKCDLSYKQSQNKRLLVELALLNICNIETNVLTQPTGTVQEKRNEVETVEIEQTEEKKVGTQLNDGNKEEKKIVEKNIEKVANTSQQPINQPLIKGVSLKSLEYELQNPKQAEVVEFEKKYLTELTIGEEEFDSEKLNYVWIKYAESLRENPRLYTFLTGHIPQKDNDFNYIVNVENQAIKSKLESFLHETISFMKTELNNRHFNLKYEIIESDKKIIKTDEEKLEELINKNPVIGELKKGLNLDFE